MSALRLYIAEDHPVFREGLVASAASRDDLVLVGEADDGRQALAEIVELVPDLALLDVRLPGLRGPELLREVADAGIATRVVFLSAYEERQLVYDVLADGAAGFLAKTATRDEIMDGLAAAGRGDVVLSRSLQTLLATEITRREEARRALLSPRELEVLQRVAEGASAPAIARELHLGTTTVKGHLQSVYEKLEVGDRAAAVAVAMRKGLLR